VRVLKADVLGFQMRMSLVALCFTVFTLGGRGTRVPNIQEIGNDTQGENLVKAIVGSIHCDLRKAVYSVIKNDGDNAQAPGGVRNAAFLDNWGVQISLTLTVEEKTTVNPASVWLPFGWFTFGASASVSADATRKDILNYFYSVKDLYRYGPCPTEWVQPHPPGSLLIQNNLKIDQWLSAQVLLSATGQIGYPRTPDTMLKQNALSHEVKFEVISSGSANPGVKIATFTLDQAGSLFTASRDRTHDLLVTNIPALYVTV
jgi:hypothetical protein